MDKEHQKADVNFEGFVESVETLLTPPEFVLTAEQIDALLQQRQEFNQRRADFVMDLFHRSLLCRPHVPTDPRVNIYPDNI